LETDHLEDLGVKGENDIKIDVKETGYEDMDWIKWAQDREKFAGCCGKSGKHCASINFEEFQGYMRSY